MQASEPAQAEETGIQGTVVWGPLKPGPEVMGQSGEAPLRASFLVMQDGKIAAQFQSDHRGRFEVALLPGDYVIVPDKSIPIPNPARQTTIVTVPDSGYVTIKITLDTGLK